MLMFDIIGILQNVLNIISSIQYTGLHFEPQDSEIVRLCWNIDQ